MPSFRLSDSPEVAPNSAQNPAADVTSLDPGQLGFSMADTALHDTNSPTNVPNPRGNPAPDTTPAIQTPASVRRWRAPDYGQGAGQANNDEGVLLDPSTGYAIGNQSGGALTGAFGDMADADAHFGFDPLPGEQTTERGVGLKDYGQWNSRVGGFADVQSHELHPDGVRFLDPRNEEQTGMTDVAYSFGTETVSDDVRAAQAMDAQSVIGIEKPQSMFLAGREATRPAVWLFERAYDQWASQNFSGEKVFPSMPPDVGGSTIDQSVLQASLPTMQDDVALEGTAYNGPSFGPSGMQPVAPTPNTWRLQPEPWDNQIVNAGL